MTLRLILCLTLVVFCSISLVTAKGSKWEATSFCKCVCFGTNYKILHLDFPDNPNKPCLSCTKQWCLNQNLPICNGATLGDANPDTATGKEGDVEARCFQRDSPRDQLIVTLFLLTVFGLLLGAGIKGKMEKAGLEPRFNWTTGRELWEGLIPRGRSEEFGLGVRNLFGRRGGSRREEYNPLSESPPQ